MTDAVGVLWAFRTLRRASDAARGSSAGEADGVARSAHVPDAAAGVGCGARIVRCTHRPKAYALTMFGTSAIVLRLVAAARFLSALWTDLGCLLCGTRRPSCLGLCPPNVIEFSSIKLDDKVCCLIVCKPWARSQTLRVESRTMKVITKMNPH